MVANAVILLLLTCIGLPVVAGAAYGLYFLFSLPMRRHERARLFLDLIESGIRHGQSPEHTILSLARTGDNSLGVDFHLLAAHLETGMRFDEALSTVPGFLPPHIAAMLEVGHESGDVGRVLPACRNRLSEGVELVWKGHHYLALVALVVSPIWIAIFSLMCIFVMPRLMQIAQDIGAFVPYGLTFMIQNHTWLIGLQVFIFLAFYSGIVLYVGGGRLNAWLRSVLSPAVVDGLSLMLPWERKRMVRDFSATLGLLLDAGMPEVRALSLAASATGNEVFRLRAAKVANALDQGLRLDKAVQMFDQEGDFQWRLANAARAGRTFADALAGWHDTLAAKAFQEEQTAAQLVTTSMVLVNGLMVGGLVVAIFAFFTRLIEAGVLW